MRTDENGVIISYPFVRTPYNYDVDAVSRETALECKLPTRTQQQFKDECDINVILDRFGATGNLPITTVQPMAGDFTGIGTYQEAIESVRSAEENFMQLPSKIRERFSQDSKKFVDFCLDPANIEAVREMGLAPRPEAPKLKDIVNGNQGTNNGTT